MPAVKNKNPVQKSGPTLESDVPTQEIDDVPTQEVDAPTPAVAPKKFDSESVTLTIINKGTAQVELRQRNLSLTISPRGISGPFTLSADQVSWVKMALSKMPAISIQVVTDV